MSSRTHTTAPDDLLVVRYRRPSGGWQAVRTIPATVFDAELQARRLLRSLLEEGRDAEIFRATPLL